LNPRLIGLSGPHAGQIFPLDRDVVAIGREPDNDIVIEEQWVSRRHCEIRRDGESFRLVDRGSHNGTSVNDVPVKERDLEPGDRIRLGAASFVFVDADAAPLPPAIELDEEPLLTGDTVQLKVRDPFTARRVASGETPDATERALAATLSMIQLLAQSDDASLPERLLRRFFDVLPAERGAILMGPGVEELDSVTMRTRGKKEPASFPVSRTVLTKVFAERTALLSNRVADELGSGRSLLRSGVTSLACLPLTAGDRVFGAVYLDARDPSIVFPPASLPLLVGLAGVAASALEKARQLGRLRAENRRLQESFELVHDMVGESEKLREAQKVLARAAPTDATVLIEGESGTGKELAARAIHVNSRRADGPLVKVDCTGLNENLLASELFGHERGAFTGAIQQKKGKLEVADGGTVFLDEVGELPAAIQAQLLRVLQDREFERVGGTRPIPVDIRLAAATNRNLAEEVKEGRFREDLYYRLNVVRVELPPLRERVEDIELLARYFVTEFSRRVRRPVVGISPEALALLRRYEWPGNVRELANTVERAVVLGVTELIIPDDLPEMLLESSAAAGPAPARPDSYHEAVAEKKKALILDAVARSGGNITEAAKRLDLHPNYLHRLIRNLGLRDRLKQS
jgi:Nif-specific regulatory protein